MIGASIACVLLAAEQAQAQDGKDDKAPYGELVGLDEIVVTATKTGDAAVDVLGGSSAIGGTQIRRMQTSKLSEVLRDVPGVTTQLSPNDPGQSVNIRGLQDFGRVNVLVDGARQDFQVSGHNANGSYYLDPEFVGSIDVTRGPISNIYGSGAIGGVVAYSTGGVDDILKPHETRGVLQRVGFGTNGGEFMNSSAAAVRAGTRADVYGQFVYRGMGDYKDGGGTRIADTGNKTAGGLFKVNVRPEYGNAISLSLLQQTNSFTNSGTSGSGTRFTNDVQTSNASLGYTFQRPDQKLLDLSAKVYYAATRENRATVEPTAVYSALGVTSGDQISARVGTVGFDVHNTSRFDTGPITHAISYGGDSAFDNVRTTDKAGGFISALTPSGQRRLSGAFVQDEARYASWLRVIGAARVDDYALRGGDTSSGGSRVSPKVTVGVTPVRGIEVYGTYAEGYRAPSVTETLVNGTHPYPAFQILANPNLRPETARNVEGGINIKYDDVLRSADKVRGKVAVFSNTVDNYIDLQSVGGSYLVSAIPGMPSAVCAGQPSLCFPMTSYQYVNVSKARLSGVELEASYDVRGGFVRVAGQHIDARSLDTNAPLISSIPDRVSVTAGLRVFDERWTIGGRLTFVAASVTAAPGSSSSAIDPTKAYSLVDLFTSYRFTDDVIGDLLVSNLFNKQYRQYLNTLNDPGLNVKGTLSLRFAS